MSDLKAKLSCCAGEIIDIEIPGSGPLALPVEEVARLLKSGTLILVGGVLMCDLSYRPASTSEDVDSRKGLEPDIEKSLVSSGPRCEPVEGESQPTCCYVMPPRHYHNHTLQRCFNCGKKRKYPNTELLAPPRKTRRKEAQSYEGPVGFTYPIFEDTGVPERVSKHSRLLLPCYDDEFEEHGGLDHRRDEAAHAIHRRDIAIIDEIRQMVNDRWSNQY
jgi:hypothetical protein